MLWSCAFAAPTVLPEHGLVVQRWSVEDGLPLDHVSDLAIAPDGSLWVATVEGLYIFDGRDFVEQPRVAEALGSSRIYSLTPHPDGSMWLVGEAAQALRVAADGTSLHGHAVNALFVEDDSVWMHSQDGIFRVGSSPVPWGEEFLDGPPNGLGFGPDGSHWFTRPDGAVRVLPGGGVVRYPAGEGLPPELWGTRTLREGGPWFMGVGPDGFVSVEWTGSGFEPSPGDMVGPFDRCTADSKVLHALCPPRRDVTGAWAADRERVTYQGVEVWRVDDPIRVAVEDDRGGLWVATGGDGLLHLAPPLARTVLPPEGMDPRVTSVFVDDSGSPWFCEPGGHWWSPESSHLLAPTGYLLRLGLETLLVNWGLWRLDGEALEGPDIAHAHYSTTDRQGRTWLASRHRGLYVYAQGTWSHRFVGPVTALAALPDGEVVYARLDAGLWRTGPEGEELLSEEPKHVRHIRVTEEGLWVADEELGLCLTSLTGQDRRCVEDLPARGAHQSLVDPHGRLWVSTNHGVGVATPEGVQAFVDGADQLGLLVIGMAQGMLTAEANGGTDGSIALDPDGTLWVATQRGGVAIPTGFDLPDAPTASLHGVPEGPLEPGHAPVDLSWTAPELRWGDQVRFRTRLAGKDWGPPSTDRSLRLGELPAGSSVFEVQAGLAGRWGPIASATLERRPALQERPLFVGLVGLLGAGVVGLAALLRQRALRRRAEELEELVQLRTAEVRAQARRLEQVDEARTRMIVNLHHELRTPLSLVLGPLREEPGRHPLALRNAERLGELLDQLGDIAHLESGSTTLRVTKGSLTAFTRRCAARFEGVEVHAEGPAMGWFDAGLLEKVVGNLVHNALKFSGQPVRVEVFSTPEHLGVRVLDRGDAIPEDLREQVFERLFQVQRGDAREHEGSGLGLAIAKEVVDLHGGDLHCAAREGGGNVFTFTIPAGTGHLAPEDIALDGPERPLDEPRGEGATVLVVEDNADMRAYLASSLSQTWRIVTAADGEQGLERALEGGVDLVVSDVMMPRMDGVEMARRLRSQKPELPLVLVSAKTRLEDRAAGLEVADAWLTKPFYMPELHAHVARLLEGVLPTVSRPEADDRFEAALEAVARPRLGDQDLSLEDLAHGVGMSERSLQRRCADVVGKPVSTWLRELRLAEAQQLLERGTFQTVGEVAAAVGMSRSYFSRSYRAWCGRSPAEDLLRS